MADPKRDDPIICVRLSQALNERLRAECSASGVELSTYVRGLLADALPAEPSTGAARVKPAKARARGTVAVLCEHRVRKGSYCPKCKVLV